MRTDKKDALNRLSYIEGHYATDPAISEDVPAAMERDTMGPADYVPTDNAAPPDYVPAPATTEPPLPR